uniref:Transmembrane protein n=1 Tax=Heterorhabditis bacteriophora TaxID=37862 RepID=A0A1I7WC59_HETBA
MTPVVVARNKHERVLIEPSVNSVRYFFPVTWYNLALNSKYFIDILQDITTITLKCLTICPLWVYGACSLLFHSPSYVALKKLELRVEMFLLWKEIFNLIVTWRLNSAEKVILKNCATFKSELVV